MHNYGFAVDICLIIDGKVASFDHKNDWDNDQLADWFECVKIFVKHGWDYFVCSLFQARVGRQLEEF